MSQLTTYPLADWFKATLDQSYNGTGTTIYVDDVPNITRPSGVFTYLVIAPKTSNQQIVKLSWFDSIAKTFTVSSTTVKKWAGTNYSTSTHAIGTEVIISSNYAFWEDIKTAINDNDTRITTNATNIAAINNTINSNINSIQAWSYTYAVASGTNTYTATLAPAITSYTIGMEVTLRFENANTWNSTINLNGIWAVIITDREYWDIKSWVIAAGWIYQLIYWQHPSNGNYYFAIQSENFATMNNKGIIQLSNDNEALNWGDSTKAITPYQGALITRRQYLKTTRNTLWLQTISHALGKVPKIISVQAVGSYNTTYNIDCNSFGKYDWTNQYCTYKAHVWSSWQQGVQDNIIAFLHDDISTWPVNNQMVWTLQNVTSSQFEINWTNTYWWGNIQNVTMLIEIA